MRSSSQAGCESDTVLPSDVANLVFLSKMSIGKGSQEKTGVMFYRTKSSAPGNEMLTVVSLVAVHRTLTDSV